MIALIKKASLKKWIKSLQETPDRNMKVFIGVSRKKYKTLADLMNQAMYEDMELNVIIKQFSYMGKGKIIDIIEKHGIENIALDDSTISHEDDLRVDDTYHFYKMIIKI